ncbi:LysR family transcriptional regulator [Demequina aestuarii]|uniref:LysR family transcriptional regulator n=1 Tax=Demequina aestuarii TaxID=327095 RepID=UPI0007845F8E|nr:LysR family transcriptional regulator [Demequina aestuarii]
MIDLTAVRSLVAVVETGSIAEAARELGYSASAVSRHVTALERHLGVTLLRRGARASQVLLAARIVADHARLLLEEEAAFLAAVEEVRAGSEGVVRIAYTRAAATTIVPSAMAIMRRSYPRVRVDAAERDTDDEVTMLLEQGRADVGLVWGFPEPEASDLELTPLLDEALILLTAADRSDLHVSPLDLAALTHEPRISHTVHRGSPPRVDQMFEDHGLRPPEVVYRAADHAQLHGMVRAGLGIALVPSLGIVDVHSGVWRSVVAESFRVTYMAARADVADTRHVGAITRALASASKGLDSIELTFVGPESPR